MLAAFLGCSQTINQIILHCQRECGMVCWWMGNFIVFRAAAAPTITSAWWRRAVNWRCIISLYSQCLSFCFFLHLPHFLYPCNFRPNNRTSSSATASSKRGVLHQRIHFNPKCFLKNFLFPKDVWLIMHHKYYTSCVFVIVYLFNKKESSWKFLSNFNPSNWT